MNRETRPRRHPQKETLKEVNKTDKAVLMQLLSLVLKEASRHGGPLRGFKCPLQGGPLCGAPRGPH